jgi:hypothetical protein
MDKLDLIYKYAKELARFCCQNNFKPKAICIVTNDVFKDHIVQKEDSIDIQMPGPLQAIALLSCFERTGRFELKLSLSPGESYLQSDNKLRSQIKVRIKESCPL